MGKKQHQKDKLYLTTTEWSAFYGGKKAVADVGEKSKFRRLPFFCCSYSMQPFEHPYCTGTGIIFDLINIVPFLKRYGVNPVTGEKLNVKELIKLNFFKNAEGKYHCPVTFKIFNENSHIVAVRTSGNVLSYDAVERLNIKPNFWKDLVTDEPFTRKDIITIQDPTNLDKFNLANFYHIRKNLKLVSEEDEAARRDSRYHLKSVNAETRGILDELDRTYTAADKPVDDKTKADVINAAHYSTGKVAASFTSTAMVPETQHEAAIIDEDILRYERVKKKAYIRIATTHGNLNVELHSDMVPKTCENFLKHCLSGYYKDTIFHRSIRNFMIQGGDPEGTGEGGQSIWGQPFKDEFKPNLTHTGRGILSMANSGPNTNKSQFFITYRSARHLDNKHSVFGRVVGGLETLDKMEKVETDRKDRPQEEIKILDTQVFVNPYDEVDEMLKVEREEALSKAAAEVAARQQRFMRRTDDNGQPRAFKSGIGKYINPHIQKRTFEDEEEISETERKKRQRQQETLSKSKLQDFSHW
jgi:peptidyl-prolyl cis-trans isomerase-like protein 2